MKIYKTFKELKEAPKEIQDFYMEMEAHEPPIDETQFMYYYGGDVYLLEVEEDFLQLDTPEYSEPVVDGGEYRWLNITETPAAFDSCNWISTGGYVEIFTATCNTGGPTYFIPKELVDKCPNVLKSIELSNPDRCV
jgi:hypothetical protein